MFKKVSLIISILSLLNFGYSQVASAQEIKIDGDTATIITKDGNHIIIDGNTLSKDGKNLFHSFQEFGLSAEQIATFLTNPNIQNILSRVTGGNPSYINGLIEVVGGNSNLFIMNPAGIVFGKNATLNVPADFTATTATGIQFNQAVFEAIGNNNYQDLIGNPSGFVFNVDKSGNIINSADLKLAEGANFTLVAGNVINTGKIETPNGKINVQAVNGGSTVKITPEGSLLSLEIDLPTDEQGNLKNITTQDLPTLLTGANDAGLVTENIAVNPQSGNVEVAGVAIPNESGLNIVSGIVETSSTKAGDLGGEVTLLGDKVAIIDGKITANGDSGGGKILIGRDKEGQGTIKSASITYVSPDSEITANAKNTGNGGEIIIFAEDHASIHGELTAKGGKIAGNGGFIETSGLNSFDINTTPDVSAINGNNGEWLIDPNNISIVSGEVNTGFDPDNPFTAIEQNSRLGSVIIENALLSGNVTIATGTTGKQQGNIRWDSNAQVNYDGAGTNNTLTLRTDNNIIFDGLISDSDTSTIDSLNVIFNADADSSQTGAIGINGRIFSNGGNVILGGGNNPLTNPAYGNPDILANDGVLIQGTIDSGTGNIRATGVGANDISNAEGINIRDNAVIRSTEGNITLTGIGGNGTENFAQNEGIVIQQQAQITSINGNIIIEGTGGNVPNSEGINLFSGNISTTGTGNINLIGTGNNVTTSVSQGGNEGIIINQGGVISAVDGNINLQGTGGSTNSSEGIKVTSGLIKTTGLGNVTLEGIGGIGANSEGIKMLNGATILTTQGNINLQGTGGINNSNLTSIGHQGIDLNNQININTIDGNINLVGIGGTGTLAQGIRILQGGNISSVTGDISFNGTGGNQPIPMDSQGGNEGVSINDQAQITTVDGQINLSGVGGISGNSEGVRIRESNILTTGQGNIIIEGTGGQGTKSEGIRLRRGNISTTGSGNISLTGIGGNDLNGNLNKGVAIEGNIIAGQGGLNITGTAGSGADSPAIAVIYDTTKNLLGSLTSLGDTILNGNSGDIIFQVGTNNNLQTVSITNANNVTLRDINSLNLDDTNISGDLNIITQGNITDSGSLQIEGNTFLDSNGNNITLDSITNDFNTITLLGNANNVILVDANNLNFGLSNLEGSNPSLNNLKTAAQNITFNTPVSVTNNLDVIATQFFVVTETNNNGNSLESSNGIITITHGGGNTNPVTPFIVGSGEDNIPINGTVGAISTSSETINPTQSIQGNFIAPNGTIKIFTINNNLPIVPAIDGIGSVVDSQDGIEILITQGTISGNNLYHSFTRFDLPESNQIANFIVDNSNIQNILARISSGNASIINGEIRITGNATPNLFLINPAGIVFGSTASINVPADFMATTATAIGLNDQWFNSNGIDFNPILFTGNPNSLAFNGLESYQPAGIVNAGNLNNANGDIELISGTEINTGNTSTNNKIGLVANPNNNQIFNLNNYSFVDVNSSTPIYNGSVTTLQQLVTDSDVNGNLGVTTTNNPNILTVNNSGVSATFGDVIIEQSVNGNDVQIIDYHQGIILGNLNVGNDLIIDSLDGDITQTQSSLINVSNLTQLTALTQNDLNPNANITLNNSNNDFNLLKIFSADNLQLTDINNLIFSNNNITSDLALNITHDLTLTVNGSITQTNSSSLRVLGDVNLTTNASNLGSVTLENSLPTVLAETHIGGNFNLTSSGDVSQTDNSTLQVAGKTTINAPNIDLNNQDNIINNNVNFTVDEQDNIRITKPGVLNISEILADNNYPNIINGELEVVSFIGDENDLVFEGNPILGTAFNLTGEFGGNISLTTITPNIITVDNSTPAIIQTSPFTVKKTATLIAQPQGNINLMEANEFSGPIEIVGRNVNLNDISGVLLSDIIIAENFTLQADGTISQIQSANIAVAGDTSITSTIDNFGDATITNTNKNDTVLDTVLVGGDFNLISNGNVTQTETGQVQVAGVTNIQPSFNLNNENNIINGNQPIVEIDNQGNVIVNQFGIVNISDILNSAEISDNITGNLSIISRGGNNLVFDGKAINGNAITLTGNFGGNLSIKTTAPNIIITENGQAGIIQSSPLTVAGKTLLNASTNGDIILNQADNDFIGAITTTANNLTLNDINDLVLSDTNINGNLNLTIGNSIIQTESALISVAGNTNLTTTAENLGTVNLTNNSPTILNEVLIGGDFNLTSTGNVSQTEDGSVKVAGFTNINSPSSILDNPNNIINDNVDLVISSNGDVTISKLGIVNVSQALSKYGLDNNITGNLEVISNVGGEGLIFDGLPLLGEAINLTGEFVGEININTSAPNIISQDNNIGGIIQSDSLTVAGITLLNATTNGDIILNQVDNDFIGAITTTANNLTLNDVNDVVLSDTNINGNLSLTVGNRINQTESALISVGGDTNLTTTADNLGTVNLTNNSPTVLNEVLIGGDFNLISNGNVTQTETGQVQVAGVTNIQPSFNLNNENNIINGNQPIVAIDNQGNVIVNQFGIVNISDILNSAEISNNITGNLSIISWGGNNLAFDSNAINGQAITLTGDFRGNLSINTTAPNIIITENGQAGIIQSSPLTVIGNTSLSANQGDIILNNSQNDFVGDISILSANNVTLNDINDVNFSDVAIENNLQINTLGTTNFNGNLSASNITSIGDQNYNQPLNLNRDINIQGNNITFNNSIDSVNNPHNLTVTATNNIRYGDNSGNDTVGGVIGLRNLTNSARDIFFNINLNESPISVKTTGNQQYITVDDSQTIFLLQDTVIDTNNLIVDSSIFVDPSVLKPVSLTINAQNNVIITAEANGNNIPVAISTALPNLSSGNITINAGKDININGILQTSNLSGIPSLSAGNVAINSQNGNVIVGGIATVGVNNSGGVTVDGNNVVVGTIFSTGLGGDIQLNGINNLTLGQINGNSLTVNGNLILTNLNTHSELIPLLFPQIQTPTLPNFLTNSNITTTNQQTYNGNIFIEDNINFKGNNLNFNSGIDSFSANINENTNTLPLIIGAFANGIQNRQGANPQGVILIGSNINLGDGIGDDRLGSVAGLSNLTINSGLTNININTLPNLSSINTIGNQTFNTPVNLIYNTVLTGNNITFSAPVISSPTDTKNLTINTRDNGITFFGDNINNINQLNINQDGITIIESNEISTIGNQTYGNQVILANPLILSTNNGNINFTNTLNSQIGENKNLSINTNGNIFFNGAVGNQQQLGAININNNGITQIRASIQADSLNINPNGTTQINNNITTTGDQIFNNPVQIFNNAVLNANNIIFGNTLNGNGSNLTLNSNNNGNTIFKGTVNGLNQLTTNPDGLTIFNTSSLTTTGNQNYNDNITIAENQNLNLTSFNGIINTQNIQGEINNLNITANEINTRDIVTSGGNLQVTANKGNINTGNLDTSNLDKGGNINLNSSNEINTQDINTSGNQQAGNVTIKANNDIQFNSINARSLNGNGANINVETPTLIRGTGIIPNSNNITISTLSQNGNDSIRLKYDGDENIPLNQRIPFIVGNAGINGTSGAIESSQVTISQGIFPFTEIQKNVSIISVNNNFDDNNQINLILNADPSNNQHFDVKPIESEVAINQLENISIKTISQVQAILNQIEQIGTTKPAIIYVGFTPKGYQPENIEEDFARREAINTQEYQKIGVNDPNIIPTITPEIRQEDQLDILIITPKDKPVRIIVPVTREMVVASATDLWRSVSDPLFVGSEGYKLYAGQLYQWLIAPLQQTLEERKINNLLFILPQEMRFTPIAALYDENKQEFLVENYSSGLAPSLNLNDNTYRSIKDLRLLAMGASQFADPNITQLPAAGVELPSIKEIWDGTTLTDENQYLNNNFTIEKLKNNLQNEPYGIIHLGTHGEFNPGEIENSYIQFYNNRLSLNQIRELGLNNPLVELLVLSACETAFGNENAELGFAGLAVQAGVKTAMGSVWQVSDTGTLALMTDFYSQLKTQSIKVEALRQAQLNMLKGAVYKSEDGNQIITPNREISLEGLPENARQPEDFSHPFYWAPFTMIGNPW